MKIKSNVTTPWAAAGQTFEVDEVSDNQQWHLDAGHLEKVEDEKPKAAKKAAASSDKGKD